MTGAMTWRHLPLIVLPLACGDSGGGDETGVITSATAPMQGTSSGDAPTTGVQATSSSSTSTSGDGSTSEVSTSGSSGAPVLDLGQPDFGGSVCAAAEHTACDDGEDPLRAIGLNCPGELQVEGGFDGRIARVASADSFVPLADAANLVLLDESDIERAAREVLRT